MWLLMLDVLEVHPTTYDPWIALIHSDVNLGLSMTDMNQTLFLHELICFRIILSLSHLPQEPAETYEKKITASTPDSSVSSTWNRLASVWSSTQRKCLLWCSVAVLRSRTERQAAGRQKPGRGRQGKNSCNDDFSSKLYNVKKNWPLAHESLSCPEQQTLVKSLALWQLDLSWMGRAASNRASTTAGEKKSLAASFPSLPEAAAECPKEAIKYPKVRQIF